MVERKIKLEGVAEELAKLALLRLGQARQVADTEFSQTVFKIVRELDLPGDMNYQVSGFDDGLYLVYKQDEANPVPLPSKPVQKGKKG